MQETIANSKLCANIKIKNAMCRDKSTGRLDVSINLTETVESRRRNKDGNQPPKSHCCGIGDSKHFCEYKLVM